jgi:tRNA A-37 threonylcarbamoyl transferase component Bud32
MRIDPLLGRLVDERYRIDAEIGAGGMATIYRATRLHIGDVVAIKVLHSQLLREPKFAERFRREAQAAARLKHPNVVAIHDFGVSEEGLFYLVMELVEGQTLRNIIKDAGPIAPGIAAEIVSQLCAALSEAHRRNIVHRDIKPANIVVEMTTQGPRVKVLDFGIASLRDDVAMTAFTQTGAVLGTPAYMSPEQCLGEELDGRSDNYSLGVVLFEMLCGVVPFNSPTPTAVAIQHVQQVPPPLRVLNASISPALEDVVSRALAKRPKDRFQNVLELADAVTAAVRTPRIPFAAGSIAEPLHPAQLDATIVQAALQRVLARARTRGPLRISIAIAAAAALTIGAVWLGVRQLHNTPADHANVAGTSMGAAAFGLLKPDQIARLKSIGGAVFYPAYVPARYRLRAVNVVAHAYVAGAGADLQWTEPRKSGRAHDYELRYCDERGVCLSVTGVCGSFFLQLGQTARTLHGTSPLGRFALKVYEPDPYVNRKPGLFYVSDWLPDARMAAVEGLQKGCATNDGRFHRFTGRGITDTEALRIANSMQELHGNIALTTRPKTILVKTSYGGAMQVRDFRMGPNIVMVGDGSGYVLPFPPLRTDSPTEVMNDIYEIYYYPFDRSFSVHILREPVGFIRRRAAADLQRRLGVSSAAMCQLSGFVTLTPRLNQKYRVATVGFPECPGAVRLPGD